MGLTVERGAELGARRRTGEHPSLLAPIESGVVTLELENGSTERLDRASIAIVPSGARYRARADSHGAALVTLALAPGARASAAREYRGHVDPARFVALLAVPRVLPRTRWVDELVHRYVFERDVCEKHASAAARFLETELAKEVYFLCREREERRTRASTVREEESVVTRARALLEEDLAAPLHVRELSRRCHTSESTLLRAFARELGRTPAAYVRERRLDAALLLLKSKRYSASEVATRVGYGALAAFTSAFKRRFGAPPSEVLKADGALELLPPEGAPPRRKRRKL